MKATLVQMNSQGDKAANLDAAEKLIERAVAEEKPDLVVLPELFAYLGVEPAAIHASGETFPDGESYQRMQKLARRLKVAIHAGSVVERRGNRFYNTTVVFDASGAEIARYSKIHLFDVEVPNGASFRESDTMSRGEDIVTYKLGDATVGCAICYDLRFPELFRKLRDKGADIIVLPAAFTLATGKDHWEPLIRARAIETQTYFLAAGQALSFAEGRKWNWGHSMVVDPWGHIVAQASDGVGLTSARLDLAKVEEVRGQIPVATHHVLN